MPTFDHLRRTRARASLRRSVDLLASFRFEQTAPEKFYGPLAEDTANLIEDLVADLSRGDVAGDSPLRGLSILDVGGGPGYFHEAFARRGAEYFTVEPDVGEMAAAGIDVPASVRGSGMDLPFQDDAFDVVYSSNVAEHVPDPWRMGEEMLRATKPGGLMIFSYTIWLGPFGGHETGLVPHYIGGGFARDRYTSKHGHPPKNVFGESLFDVSCAEGLRWANSTTSGELVAAFPRYHPSWAWWLVNVPVVREFLVSNLVVVLRK
ncbi:class I SAM-dependent methyltransferase [Corynebacterium aquilae]|uniref:SAM-dependent methyltransferase n=1 Tax=Corynebacterium aquilae DSM 44791 TaxID=1431546 RepID=A0A1L7CIF2_9CORY|nr:class I SAM-dependent methyltransferase [Corynebacterium aquilae]APT85598.1 SAM-dependent methyltransferase [Corynebacterium aquilae DSM 44791]